MAKRETLDDLLVTLGVGRWQAAERAGISPTSLRAWCEGEKLPRVEPAAKLARSLGVPVERVMRAAAASRARK